MRIFETDDDRSAINAIKEKVKKLEHKPYDHALYDTSSILDKGTRMEKENLMHYDKEFTSTKW